LPITLKSIAYHLQKHCLSPSKALPITGIHFKFNVLSVTGTVLKTLVITAALSLACWLVRRVEKMTLLKAQLLLAPFLAPQSLSVAFKDGFAGHGGGDIAELLKTRYRRFCGDRLQGGVLA
jgi:hypothetical protein